MPSDEFWSDLPGERRKTPGDQPVEKPAAPVPRQVAAKPVEKAASTRSESEANEPIAVKPAKEAKVNRGFRRRWAIFIMAMLVAALGAVSGLAYLLYEGIDQAANALALDTKTIEIRHGQSARAIAQELETQGLLVSKWPFLIYLRLGKLELRAGVYSLKASLTTREIANQIAAGKVDEYRVTIPEGWRLEQIADRLATGEILDRDTFLAAARYDPVRDTLPPGIILKPGDSLEGLLFPDTYQFARGVTSSEVITAMLKNFIKRTDGLRLTYDDLILASIVEREAKHDTDRAQIAGVYTNRLGANMRLEADPTVQYAKDTQTAVTMPSANMTWWSPIVVSDYQGVVSVHNTYRQAGLPPTPISSAGLASLTAAGTPANHGYYFFLNTSDGQTHFSKTLQEHNQQKQKL